MSDYKHKIYQEDQSVIYEICNNERNIVKKVFTHFDLGFWDFALSSPGNTKSLGFLFDLAKSECEKNIKLLESCEKGVSE